MARLPNPGGDQGQWGQILNDYLAQVHNSDGTLKDGIVAKEKLSSAVQASLDNADAAVSGSVPDANTTTKGKIQLAGDLAGTATSPVVADGSITTAKIADGTIINTDINASAAIAQSKIANLTTDLAGKASTTHAHAAADITSGTIATARLGSGSANSSTFLRGDSTWVAVSGGGGSARQVVDAGNISGIVGLNLDNKDMVWSGDLTGNTAITPSNAAGGSVVRLLINNTVGAVSLSYDGTDLEVSQVNGGASYFEITYNADASEWYLSGAQGPAGQDGTDGQDAAVVQHVSVLQADATAITSQTTLQNSGLSIPISSTGTQIWSIEIRLIVSAANGTMDLKVGWHTIPSGTTGLWGSTTAGGGGIGWSAAVTTTAAANPLDSLTAARNTGTSAGGTRGYTWSGIVYGGGTAGNLIFGYAQDVSDAGALQLLKGSHIRATRLAA